MSTFQRIKEEFLRAIQQAARSKSSAYDTQAEVLRIDEEGTAWVHIPGGAEETPVELSIDAKEGDIVQVRVADGRAWMNGNNTAPPTDDTKANQAQASADSAQSAADQAQADIDEEKEYFWHDDAGAHVKGKAYRTDIKSDGMKIIEAATEEEVARFGADGAQIGKDSEAHVAIEKQAMRLIGKYGSTFEVVDTRDADGLSEYTETKTSTGSATLFVEHALSSITSVSVNGTVLDSTEYHRSPQLDRAIVLNEAPAAGASIEITYKSPDIMLWYTFGYRDPNGNIGTGSVAFGSYSTASGSESHAEGAYTKASGGDSHAEGMHTTASGGESHAEGYYTVASGLYSHAEGQYCEAGGGSSHAQNTHTKASGSAQTAIGRYNVEDASSIYGLIMGNGNSTARSNAFGVTWDGDYEFALDSTAAAGTVDGDLYAAINAKGWLNAIAGTGDLISLKLLLTKILQTI